MSRLIDGPIKPWVGEIGEEVRQLDDPDHSGFEILQDSRILDLRPWNPVGTGKYDADSQVYGYRRLKVRKRPSNQNMDDFRVGLLAASPKTIVRFPRQQVRPKLYLMHMEGKAPGEKLVRLQVSVDFSKVPKGEIVDITYEHHSPGVFLTRGDNFTTLTFQHELDCAEVTRWILMPRGKEYTSFRIVRNETGKPNTAEAVKGFTEYMADDSSILAYKLVSVKSGYTHEVTWFYK
jgi:hypothetical protein